MENDINSYLKGLIEQYKTDTSKFHYIVDHMKRVLVPWGKGLCNDLIIMGSVAHGTTVKKDDKEDLDLLVSCRSDSPYTVEELYNSLHKFLKSKEYDVEIRNISMRIQFGDVSVDFVPAIKHPGSNMHTVWSRKEEKELKSDVSLHKKIIIESGRQEYIKLLKIWCLRNNVAIDGIHLGFSTIEALKNSKTDDMAENMLTILKYLATQWEYQKFADPSRPEDLVSDNTEMKDRKKVVKAAKKSLKADTWNQVFGE